MSLKQSVKFVPKEKSAFFSVLRQRVDQYFIENKISKHANREMVIKTISLLALYIVPFVCFIAFEPAKPIGFLLWGIMGVAAAGVGMSIMHDANHGAYSAKKWVNTWVGYSINMVGGSGFNWVLQHNVLHHTYTNIHDVDEDIKDRIVLRFCPHTDVRWYHKFQPFYAVFLYSLLSLYWVTFKDFSQFYRYIRIKVNNNTWRQNTPIFIKIVLSKIGYYAVFFGIPVYLFNVSFSYTLIGFLIMHAVAGIILTVIFQMAHTVEGTSHPLPNSSGNIENDWAMHQLATTVNFSPENRWLSWYVGGLNFQVEHHLFTRICHVHYPAIAPIVKQTCAEFGVPYLENRTFMQALNAHISALQKFGHLPDLDEAIG